MSDAKHITAKQRNLLEWIYAAGRWPQLSKYICHKQTWRTVYALIDKRLVILSGPMDDIHIDLMQEGYDWLIANAPKEATE